MSEKYSLVLKQQNTIVIIKPPSVLYLRFSSANGELEVGAFQ